MLDEALNNYIVETVSNVIDFARPLFISLLIVWIALWGYMMMFGYIQEPLKEGVFRIIRIGAILTLGLTVGTYMDVVVNFLQGGPEQIATIVAGEQKSIANTLDTMYLKVFAIAEAAWKQGGILNGNFGMYLLALNILLFGAALMLFITYLIVLSKLMTTVLLGIGPLFIIMLLFNVTKRFFESWLNLLVNFGLMLVLATSIGILMISFADTFLTNMAPTEDALANLANLADASVLSIVLGFCILMMLQVSSVSAGLGGGIALATGGVMSTALNALRPSVMQRGLRSVGRDIQTAKNVAGAPFRGAQKVHAAYQKRFGGNSIVGRKDS